MVRPHARCARNSVWLAHMIGATSTAKTIVIMKLALNRAPPPNRCRSFARGSTSMTVAILAANHVARARHKNRLELAVAEHVAFDQRAFRKHRQLTMRHQWSDTHDGIMAPVRPAIALPPGAADGVGAHAQPHPELEDAGKGAGRRHADHQALHDAEPRIDLHDAHELEHEVDGHHAVGVEHDCEVVILAPALTKVADIAGLEPDIFLAPAVGERDPSAPCRQRRKARVLGGGDVSLAGVAEHIDVEALADATRGEAFHHRLEHAYDTLGA